MLSLEQKIAAAKAHPGVAYDHRNDKFFARIMVRGTRMHLGYFPTAEEAGAAYKAARAAEPITRDGRDGGVTVDDAFQGMLENPDYRDERGFLIEGKAGFMLMPGQSFDLVRVEYRKARPGAGRKRWIWWIFEAKCLLCDTPFETKVRLGVKHLHGVTRNCERHRGVKGEPWSLLSEKQERAPAPVETEIREPAAPRKLRPLTQAFVDKHMAEHGGTLEQALEAYAAHMEREILAKIEAEKKGAEDLV